MTSRPQNPSLFEGHPAVMLLFDLDSLCIVDANPAAAAFYGYTRAELRSMCARDIDVSPLTELHSQAAAFLASDSLVLERQHRLADGSVRDVRALLAQVPSEGAPHCLAIIEDITSARQEREGRAQVEAVLEAMFRISSEAIVAIDHEGRVRLWSGEAERLFGWRASEVLGRFNPVIPAEDATRYRESLAQLRDLPGPVTITVPAVCRDGRRIMVQLCTTPLDDGAGTVLGALTVLREVNEDAATAKHALRAAADAYESLFHSLTEAVFIQDRDGRFLDVNDAAVRMYGYSRSELIGQTPQLLAVPGRNDMAAIEQAIARAFAGEAECLDFWGQRRDGGAFPQEVVLTPATYWGSHVVIATARDVTAQHEAAEALRASERRSRALIENVSDMISIIDAETQVLYLSPAVERTLGWKQKEFYGQPALALVHPDERERLRRAVDALIADPDRTFQGEFRFKRLDGEYRILEVVASNRLTEPSIGGIVVASRDVTERRAAEQQLRENEQRYRLMVEGSEQVFFYVHDREGVFQYLSPSISEVLGVSAAELLGRSYEPLLTGDASSALVEERTAQLFDGRLAFTTYSATIRHQSGRVLTLEFTEAPVVRAGEIVGVQGFARDITARATLEEQLRQAQKMEAVGRLAGGVAHDFNNLLTAVNGHAELALWAIPDTPAFEPAREEISAVQAAAQRAASLTRQLLAFSRKQVLQPTVVSLDEVVQGLDRMLRRLIGEDVLLTTELGANGGHVLVDRGQLEQAILNLAINARDAMAEGGALEIATLAVHLDERTVHDTGTLEPGDYVQIRVSDTGSGIPHDVVPLIWEPFFTTKEIGRGTGLGLSTVYGMVQQSNGTISVSTQVGCGTTFTIWLPLCSSAPACAVHRSAAAPPVRSAGRVLLVEDEPAVRTLAQRVLRQAGFEVVPASDAAEVLALLGAHEFDFDGVVSDVVMPGMSGIALAGLLRQRRADLPILLMSGYSDQAVHDPTTVPAPSAFLPKPFTGPELVGKLNSLLALRVP